MKCVDPDCKCLSHVSPETHVPSCPVCLWPLIRATHDATRGACILGCNRFWAAPGDMDAANWWVWLHRDLFNTSDMPPANGFKPVLYDVTPGVGI